MFVPLKAYKDHRWNEYTLIFPVVSVGNAAQLAVDLLLSSLPNELVGYIHSTALLPLVGGNPYRVGDNRLATACQVYVCHQSKLLIVQQRTPVSPNCRAEYRQFLTSWIKSENFKLVIMLSSCLSQFSSPSELSRYSVHYYCSPSVTDMVQDKLSSLCWKKLEKQDPVTNEISSDGVLLMPGSGITRSLLEKCVSDAIPVVLLLLYCSEGDNTPDAILLADRLNEWLHLCPVESSGGGQTGVWQTPVSWSMLFGSGPPTTIY
ncbi:proteasome assembly chaperone 2-like [Ornithodoros turicata]|uniref:Proteasome assembly chaperone 2 n=1 Tax=Ornithodoros turicata TaxID=34597 RepID=A0A2R5LDI5_9ACAR